MVHGSHPRRRRSGVLQGRVEHLPSAKLTPVERSGRQLEVYDPTTKKIDMIDTCFGTHHLLFAEDGNNTLWTSSGGGGGVVGWLNTKMWDKTHDAAEIARLDGAGAGHQRQWQARRLRGRRAGRGHRANGESLGTSSAVNTKTDPTKDTRLNAAFYGIGDYQGRHGVGFGAGLPGRDRATEPGTASAGNRAGGILRSALERSKGAGVGLFATRHGYGHATAWPGWRWPAGTSRASTGASAKGR